MPVNTATLTMLHFMLQQPFALTADLLRSQSCSSSVCWPFLPMTVMEITRLLLKSVCLCRSDSTFEQAADYYEGKQTKRGAFKVVLKSTGWGVLVGGVLGAAIAAGLAVLSTSAAAVVAAGAGIYSGASLKQTPYLCQHRQMCCCCDMVLVTELEFQLCPIP